MHKVTHGNKTIYFCKKEDAENYKDFLENGLKIVRQSCGGWLFNDGAVFIQYYYKRKHRQKVFLEKRK